MHDNWSLGGDIPDCMTHSHTVNGRTVRIDNRKLPSLFADSHYSILSVYP